MKTALILPTALGISSEEKRIQQFITGFKQAFDLVSKYPMFDVFVVDSTISDITKIDERIIEAIGMIPTLQEKVFFYDNELGKKNKGVGLIVQWKEALTKISKDYEYVISFEPRQELKDFSFFETFIKNPSAYARVTPTRIKKFKMIPVTINQILTGLVCLTRHSMDNYSNGVNLEVMVQRKINIEQDLYNFLTKNSIAFTQVELLGVLWHDMVHNGIILI
jgi:hypothetical protein